MAEYSILRNLSTRLRDSSDILLLGHKSADGDSLGSMIALGRFLVDQLGKNVSIPFPKELPQRYAFLERNMSDMRHYDGNSRYTTVLIDCSSAPRMDIGGEENLPDIDIIIDHHEGVPDIGEIIYKDTQAPAAGLLVYRLLVEMGCEFTPEISNGLYTAILTDTGQFAFSGTTKECFDVAGFLVEKGASPEMVAKSVYWNHPMSYISNMRTALNSLEFYSEGQISVIKLTADNVDSPALLHQTEGIVDLGIMIEGVKIALLFRELEPNNIRISFRSRQGYDVSVIARSFGGGGRINASGCNIHDSIENAQKKILNVIIPMLGE